MLLCCKQTSVVARVQVFVKTSVLGVVVEGLPPTDRDGAKTILLRSWGRVAVDRLCEHDAGGGRGSAGEDPCSAQETEGIADLSLEKASSGGILNNDGLADVQADQHEAISTGDGIVGEGPSIDADPYCTAVPTVAEPIEQFEDVDAIARRQCDGMQAKAEGACGTEISRNAQIVGLPWCEAGEVGRRHQARSAVVITGHLGERPGTCGCCVHGEGRIGHAAGSGLDVHDARSWSYEREPDVATEIEATTRCGNTCCGCGSHVREGLEQATRIDSHRDRSAGVVVGDRRRGSAALDDQRSTCGGVPAGIEIHENTQLAGEGGCPGDRGLCGEKSAGKRIIAVSQAGTASIVEQGDLGVEGRRAGAEGVNVAGHNVHQGVLPALHTGYGSASRAGWCDRRTGERVIVGALRIHLPRYCLQHDRGEQYPGAYRAGGFH